MGVGVEWAMSDDDDMTGSDRPRMRANSARTSSLDVQAKRMTPPTDVQLNEA